MKYHITIIVFAFFICSCSSTPPLRAVQFKADSIRATTKTLRKVKIIGYGPTPTRQFLDDFSEQLIIDLRLVGINADYTFFVDKEQIREIEYNITDNYDAMLVLRPTSNAYVNNGDYNEYYFTTPRGLGNLPVTVSSRGETTLEQHFLFELHEYVQPIPKVPFWEAMVKINSSTTTKQLYRIISSKVIGSFKQLKLCN